MTGVDAIVIVWVALSALSGARRGLVVTAVGLAGFAAGAVAGSRIAPHLLSQGARSPWQAVAGLVGALVGGILVRTLADVGAGALRSRLMIGPLAALDTAGGAIAGVVTGLALAWLVAVVALDQTALHLRRDVQRSAILPALLRVVPPAGVLDALARFDPLPVIPSLAGRALPAPDPAVLRAPGALRAAASVVRIQGTACGLGVEGSGWVARTGIVVTNAHVVAGESDTVVQPPGGGQLPAVAIAVDRGNDVAVLRVPGLAARRLRLAPADPSGQAAALIGYPLNGPLVAAAGRAGQPVTAIAPDAYGQNPRPRTVVPLRGRLEHGDSGGPVVDARGRVLAMMFAADRAGGGGFGVPLAAIRAALAHAGARTSTGPCIG